LRAISSDLGCEYEKRAIAHILLSLTCKSVEEKKMARETLLRLFRHKAWADDELLTALAELGAENSVTQLAIKALSHSLVVDRIFAAHLRRTDHPYESANLADMPTLDDLSAQIRASDREYLDYVAALTRDQLAEPLDFTFTDGAPGRMSREEMLMHVITHGGVTGARSAR
jgi:uncharacterized damage-inducible protein DinB